MGNMVKSGRGESPRFRQVLSATLALMGILVSLHPAMAPGAVKAKESASDELFTNTSIRRLSILIPPEGMATLRKYRWRREPEEEGRVNVSATVREGDLVWTNVALHLKGAAGSFRTVDSKPALTLNFDKFADGQRFHGLQKISLNNSVQDPSFLNEKLCREIFLAAGVPVPRADYAVVELNGRALGPYVLVEGWNKPFLKRYFKNAKGNLYDGSFGKDINSTLPVNSGEKPEDQQELQELYAVCTNADMATRWAKLGEVLDLERFITLQALDVMMWNWDGYAMNRNNYRLFHDLDTHRLVFMPHGLDQMFWQTNGALVTGVKGIAARAVMQTPEGRKRFLERVTQLRASLFNVEAMTKRVNELSEQVRPAVAEGGIGPAVQHSAWVKIQRDRIADRAASIDEQLAGIRAMTPLAAGTQATLTNWLPQTDAGKADFTPTPGEPGTLYLAAHHGAVVAMWRTTVWLEEGTYRVTGRIRTRDVVTAAEVARAGASLHVCSRRKINAGVHWDWFPYRESRDPETRGEIPPVHGVAPRTGTTDWTEVSYEFELRQPMADLEISCELRAESGEAWFDPGSLRLTRTKRGVSANGLPASANRGRGQ